MAERTRRKNPRSTAMRWMEWISQRKDFKRGEKATARTVGACVYAFKRAYPRYIYSCSRKRMTLGTFEKWAKSGSKGKYYNRYIRGVY